MPSRKRCSDLCRRDLLKIGAAGFGGLGLGMFGCIPSDDRVRVADSKIIAPVNAFYDAVIQVWFEGGPSQTDTWDPKPGSASNVFTTSSLGVMDKYNQPIQLTTVLPHIQALAQSAAAGLGIVRSLTHTQGDHTGATLCSQSFWKTIGPAMLYPSVASVLAYYFSGQSPLGIPAVSIDGELNDTKGNPIPAALEASVGNMGPVLTMPVSSARYDRRKRMLQAINAGMLARYPDAMVPVADRGWQDAYGITTKGIAASAFDLTGKTLLPAADGYFSQKITIAQELVKAGVLYVGVGLGGNDSHTDNRATITTNWGQNADPAIAQLAKNLIPTGKRVLIVMGGEFGRTPTLSTDPKAMGDGRDHWPDGFSWAFVSINQPKFKTGAVGNTGPDGLWTVADANLIDPYDMKDFGAFLYKALGFQVGDPTYNVPLIDKSAPPVDPTNKSADLLTYFGLAV
jgi:hypothetical protein